MSTSLSEQGNRIQLKKHLATKNTEDTQEQTSYALDSRLQGYVFSDFCFSRRFWRSGGIDAIALSV
jgi:hypothetical protein